MTNSMELPAITTKPVEESIAKINDDLALGEDLAFQRRWWVFEKVVWTLFALIILADLLGCFGRGPLANAHLNAADGSMDLRYERVERFTTPSIMTINFGPGAIHDGKVQLWVSDNLVKTLGNQRVIPQPERSVVGQGGILYTFAAAGPPTSVEFALQPAKPGIFTLHMHVPGLEELHPRIFVMP